jgi:hypothetical protein
VESNEIVTTIGVFFGAGIAAYVGYFLKAKPPGKQIEVAGALVDGSSAKDLAEALRDHATAIRDGRDDAEKGRKVAYELREQIGKLTDEVEELRRVVGDGANQIARRR